MEVDDSSIKLTAHKNGVTKTGEEKSCEDSNESTGELDVSKETDVQNGSFDEKDDTSVKDVDSCSEKETEGKTVITTAKVPEKGPDENLNNDKWKLRLDLSDSCSVTENEGTDAEDNLDMKSTSKQLVGKLSQQDGDEPEERDGFLGYEAPLCTPEAIIIMSKLVAKYERELEGEEKMETDNFPDDLETSSIDLKLYQGKEDSAPEISLSSNGSSPTTDTSKSSGKGKGASGNRTGTKKFSINLADPAFKKPFEFGWKRELVYRNTADIQAKRMADIYYYTPSGKKVRSNREVIESLTGTDLTIDNFTFFKESLGINDPDKEIIRDAKRISVAGSKELNLTPGRKNSKGKSAPNSPDLVSHEIKSDDIDDEEDDKEEKDEAEMTKSKTSHVVKLARTFPRIKVTPTRLQRNKSQSVVRNKSGSAGDLNMDMGTPPPTWKDKDGDSDIKMLSSPGTKATSVTQKSFTSVKQTSVIKVAPSVKTGTNPAKQRSATAGNISPSMKSGQPTKVAMPSNIQTSWPQANSTSKLTQHKKFEPCSIRCAGMMGVIPSLQCRLCLCLYHTQCVGIGSISGPIHSYICKNCQQLKDIAKVTTNSIITTTPPPLKPISSMGAGSQTISGNSENKNDDNTNNIDNNTSAADTSPITPSSSPPKLQRFPRQQGDSSSSKVVMVPRYVKVSPTEQKQLETVAQTTGVSTITTTRSMSTVCSLTTWVPPSSIQVSGGGTLLPMPSISPAATLLTGSAPPPPPPNQALAQVMGKKYIVLPRHGSIALHTPIPTDRPSVPPDSIPKSAATFIISGQNPPGVLLVPVLGAGATGNASAPEKPQYLLVNGSSSGIENSSNNLLSAPSVKDSDENRKRKADDDETNDDLAPSESSKRTRISYEDSSLHHFMQDFMTHLSSGYSAMLHVFGYLKVQELLRAGRVCRLWQSLANHPSLWRTVRMKNSPVVDWKGCATALQERGTRHLDLRKMLVPARAEEWWNAFCSSIGSVQSLETIELCRCPAVVVERLALQCPQLRSICALSIKCQSINLGCMSQLKYLQELRIKSLSGMYLDGNLEAFKELTCLKHLSLTMVKNLGQTGPNVLGSLKQLESLELGECSDMPQAFGTQALSQLQNLQRLRLEKGQGEDCPTTSLLAGVRLLSSLTTLELVNFDIKPGFDAALARCKNIKRLLIIPTYISQSATTNHMVLGGVTQLSHSLTHFVWGVTHELLRVTELFVDQCEDQKSAPSGASKPKKGSVGGGGGTSDSIPVLRPVPGAEDLSNGEEGNAPSSEEAGSQSQSGAPQVDILPLVKLQKLLNHTLPQTRVKILKVPFQATWRQYISETDF